MLLTIFLKIPDMNQIIIIGETAAEIIRSVQDQYPDISLHYASHIQAVQHILSFGQSAIIISRDTPLSPEDRAALPTSISPGNLLLIWPPDDEILPWFETLIQQEELAPGDRGIALSGDLTAENIELKGRVEALESAVRSLVAALSQCDPWPEAYADDHETWEMIMQGVPAAGMSPNEQGNTDEEDTYEEEYEEDD